MTTEPTLREVRIFLASSSELHEERDGLADLLESIQQRPDLRRTVRLVPVRWETDAFGGDPGDINQAIAHSVDFDRLDLVIVVVRNKIGSGTAGEFEHVVDLWQLHRKPQILVYRRHPGANADPRSLGDVARFIETVIGTGIVPREYETIGEFGELVAKHVPACIVAADSGPEPAEAVQLRRWYTTSSVLGVGLAAAYIALAQMVSYPSHGVSQATVLALLMAPVLLFMSLTGTAYLYHRLLRGLHRAWRSARWKDDDLYAAYRHVVPGFCLPGVLRPAVPHGAAPTAIAVLWLALAMGAPIYAQYWVLFHEITTWNVAVGWASHHGPDGAIESSFVDRTGRAAWFRGLQDPDARRRSQDDPTETLYVYAPRRFGSDGTFRDNLGPEVWLPAQAWVYLGLLLISVVMAIMVAVRVLGLRRNLMQPVPR